MTAKRFEVYKVIGSFHEWSIEDNLNDKVVFGCIMHKYEADRLCGLLNELHEENQSLKFQLDECQNHKLYSRRELEKENEQLKKAIVETEKMVQSTYDELTKLRCFKKNILRIKHSWDYLMEAIQYD